MADRPCRSFQPNVFNRNKCQNCFKLRDAHGTSLSSQDSYSQSGTRKQSAPKVYLGRLRTVVKSGVLCITTHEAIEKGQVHPSRWNKRWFVLNSTGTLDYFYYDEQEGTSTQRLDGNVNLDFCSGMFIGEADTGEPFSIGLKLAKNTFYLKAENRLELDNWSRVLKPFVQASQAFVPRRTSSSSSSESGDVFAQGTGMSSSLGRNPSFGKSSVTRVASNPSSTTSPLRASQSEELHTSPEKLQLEKLREENKRLREQSVLSVRQKDSAHILEQELKTKNIKLRELEKEHSQCKDYQKAVLFQEKELQEARGTVKVLKQQLEETEKHLQQQRGKISIHAKELAEAKTDLQEANSIIGIHRANIESLKGELSSVKHEVSGSRKEKIILVGEEPESDQVFSLKGEANGHQGKGDQTKDLESKLSALMQRLKQNERELMLKTRELEKANESRSKVAKYTRSLLQELESKLSSNERKLAEVESQLTNKNIELQYEIEKRQKVEGENNRLFSEMEVLSDERKKVGLSKEAVELLDRAKERVVAGKITPVEAKFSEMQPQFGDGRKTSDEFSYLEEINRLKLALNSAETGLNEKEAKLSDNEAVVSSANKEIERLKVDLNVKLQELNSTKVERNRIEEDLKKREDDLGSLNKEMRKLEDRNADVTEKNRELEERLQTVESELTESMEREIFLQQETETDEGERWNVEERVIGLEEEVSIYKDKVAELEGKLSEKELDCSNAQADKNRLVELEQRLRYKDNELKETERTFARREKELSLETEAGRNRLEIELNRDKLRIEELECQLNDLESALDSDRMKLKDRDSQLKELHVQRQSEILVRDSVDGLNSELKAREKRIEECENSLALANERIAEYKKNLRQYESAEKSYDSKQVSDLQSKVRVLQDELEDSREKLASAVEKLLDYEVEERLLTAELQKTKNEEDDSKVGELKRQLSEAEEQIKKYEDIFRDNDSKLLASEEKVLELAEELARRLQVEQETVEWIEGVESNLTMRERELSTTRESLLSKAQELDKEKTGILDIMALSMKYIKELELAVGEEKENARELGRQLDDERSRVSQLVEELDDVKALEGEGHETFDESLKLEEVEERLAYSERSRELEATRVKQLQSELEDSKRKFAEELSQQRDTHDDELRKLNEETFRVSGAANTESDELKLRLTSRVITLQSDISELKAAHHLEIEKLRANHKKDLENARREAILENSVKETIQETGEEMSSQVAEMESEMKTMTERYERQMEVLKTSHSREMDKLKRSSDGSDGLQTEVVQLQVEMENMSQKYNEEIETLKVHHAEELEQLKRDMAVVLQASLGSAPSPVKDDPNVHLYKQRIKELEEETEELSRKYNEELKIEREAQQREIEQTRNDMMTVIQAIRSEKYRLDSDREECMSPKESRKSPEDPEKMRSSYEAKTRGVPLIAVEGEVEGSSPPHKRIKQLESELAAVKEEFRKELDQKETRHGEEVYQLKADMLVALQVARSGTTSPSASANQPDAQTVSETITRAGVKLSLEEAGNKIDELEKIIAANKKQFKKDKNEYEKSLKKSEAATMFGLRRTEEMSLKIYQMQKEMEDIDRKYQKEIKMYKDAFEREKDEKCQMGDLETLSSENDSLRLEIEELDLKIEEMESSHLDEIKMYKQKLGEEKMLNVEDLRLKLKSLEDVIEEQKLEHEKEMEDLKNQRESSVQELKKRHEKDLESIKKEQSDLNVGNIAAKGDSLDLRQKEKQIRDLELKVEELETLLEVKKRRHKEEIKNLRQRLDVEFQKHSEDVRTHRTKVRQLERRKSEHSLSFGLMDENDYKRMYDEQRSENIKLKFSMEKQKQEVDELRNAVNKQEKAEILERRRSHDSRRPVSDSFTSSVSYGRSASADVGPSSSVTKEPLRKATSDSRSLDSDPVWKRPPVTRKVSSELPSYTASSVDKQPAADSAKGKVLTRQMSKGVETHSMGSVAARVALYQTVASKIKDEKPGQKQS